MQSPAETREENPPDLFADLVQAVELESFIKKAVRISQHFQPGHLINLLHILCPSVILPAPEPMPVTAYHLTRAESQKRQLQHLCLYCGEKAM